MKNFLHHPAFPPAVMSIPDIDDKEWDSLGTFMMPAIKPVSPISSPKRPSGGSTKRDSKRSKASSSSESQRRMDPEPLRLPDPPESKTEPNQRPAAQPSSSKQNEEGYVDPRLLRIRRVYDKQLFNMTFLCIVGNSYCLGNGYKMISEEKHPEWRNQLREDLRNIKVAPVLFLVGRETAFIWNELKVDFPDVRDILLEDTLLGKCSFCKKEQCPRWKIVVGGFQKIVNLDIKPFIH